MSTIIRVKRRLNEEPQDIIAFNCKRAKVNLDEAENSTENVVQTVLQLATTVEKQEDDVFKHFKTSIKETIEFQVKNKSQPNVERSVIDRIRDDFRTANKENRYKVVKLYRSNVDEVESEITIVDVESTNTETPAATIEDTKSQYVYDLYYTTSDDLGEIIDHDLVGIYPLSNELVYGSHRDNGFVDSDDNASEDSNAENNWRNDYPDEEEHDNESITEDDMVAAVNRVKLDDEDDLSSSGGEGGLIYCIDSEVGGFEEDIDESDVNRYGERYACFKAKYLRSERDKSVDNEDYYHDYYSADEDKPSGSAN